MLNNLYKQYFKFNSMLCYKVCVLIFRFVIVEVLTYLESDRQNDAWSVAILIFVMEIVRLLSLINIDITIPTMTILIFVMGSIRLPSLININISLVKIFNYDNQRYRLFLYILAILCRCSCNDNNNDDNNDDDSNDDNSMYKILIIINIV